MGVPIEKQLWRFLKKQWKKSAKKRAARKKAAERSAAQRRKQVGRTASRPTGPAAARPRPSSATPRTRRPAAVASTPAPASSSAPVVAPRAANPLNLVRHKERWETRTNGRRADSLAEKAALNAENEAAIARTRQQKAEQRAVKRQAKTDRTAAKLAAAEARHTQTQEQPTVIPPRKGLPQPAVVKRRPVAQPTQPQANPARPTVAPPAAVLCGATTDTGGSCTHPAAGDRCAAGHTPTNKARTKSTTRTTKSGGIAVKQTIGSGARVGTQIGVIFSDGRRQGGRDGERTG
jgi:hypothetical protein